MRLAALLVLAGLALAAGCGVGRSSDGSHVVTATGRVGPLHLDTSGRAAVVSFAGRPDSVGTGDEGGGFAPYRALGYGCARRRTTPTAPVSAHGPYCRTVFYLDSRTGRLETFFTSDPSYVEARGVRIGMPTAAAERILHRIVHVGCEENLYFATAEARLTIAFTGGTVKLPSTRLRGGHVYAFVLHSRRRDAGVFDCL